MTAKPKVKIEKAIAIPNFNFTASIPFVSTKVVSIPKRNGETMLERGLLRPPLIPQKLLVHSCICAYAMLKHNKGLPTVKGSLRSPTSSASPLTAGPSPLVTPCDRQANPMDCLALRMA